MADRLRTGIPVLDRELDGGIPDGSVVAFEDPPASQGELLLYQLTDARPTLYLSTDRSAEAVADAFERTSAPTGDPAIRFVEGDAPLENVRRLIKQTSGAVNVVVDPADALERLDRNRYENFVNELQNHIRNTGGLAVLHCLKGSAVPDHRAITEHMADVVFDLDLAVSGTDVETRLAVPKFRGGRALHETIKLELAEQVEIDTSRDIA